MQYVIDVNRNLQKDKFLKQRKCKDLMPSSLEYCAIYEETPSMFYKGWLDNPLNLKTISLEDFIKQQGVVTL